ncbi:hypothetical protein, partial [Tessaracoccus sp. SD287]|uniref:hypothetical protein n=1 Tax=Tessaracoccus sp. SD287 TaxID=2782008 RepID=UPI001A95753E
RVGPADDAAGGAGVAVVRLGLVGDPLVGTAECVVMTGREVLATGPVPQPTSTSAIASTGSHLRGERIIATTSHKSIDPPPA